MKIRLLASIGLCVKKQEIKIDEEDIEGMSKKQIEEYFDGLASDFAISEVESDWEEI